MAITGAIYRKRALGPTCDALLPLLRDLEISGAIQVNEVDYFGYRKKEFEPVEAPELHRLNEEERAVLGEMIDFVCRDNS